MIMQRLVTWVTLQNQQPFKVPEREHLSASHSWKMQSRISILLAYSIIAAVTCAVTATVQLKVGLYNYITDINADGLVSYQEMVQDGYAYTGNRVNAVVSNLEYDPYGDLNNYLNDGDFDLIEIDTASLTDEIKMLIEPANHIGVAVQSQTLPTAKLAVQDGPTLYGYPTLVCGNFIIGLSPSTECTCSFKDAQCPKLTPQGTYENTLEDCTNNLSENFPGYERLIGGQMNDRDGWYLPFIFLDAYIDEYGPNSVEEGIQLVLDDSQIVHVIVERLCYPLFDLCRYNDGSTAEEKYKCLYGDYVTSSSNVTVNVDIKNKKTLFFFGFSEKTALIIKQTNGKACPYAATSFSRSASNYMLQFTDALVVSKAAWENANEEKRNAIRQFITYFTGFELRRKISLGEDMQPPVNRYLLPASEDFYKSVERIPVYQDIYWHLLRSVPAPALSSNQREQMQHVLEKYLPSSMPGSDVRDEFGCLCSAE